MIPPVFFKISQQIIFQNKPTDGWLARRAPSLPVSRSLAVAVNPGEREREFSGSHTSVRTERQDGRRSGPRSPSIHLQPIRYSNGSFLLINSCVYWDRFGNLLALTPENCPGSPAPPWLLASINLIWTQKGPERPEKVLLCLFLHTRCCWFIAFSLCCIILPYSIFFFNILANLLFGGYLPFIKASQTEFKLTNMPRHAKAKFISSVTAGSGFGAFQRSFACQTCEKFFQ